MTVGKIIREKRIEMGLTQDALAEKMGVSQSHIGRIESGAVRNPRRETLIKFQETLGFDLSEYMPPEKSEEAEARYLSFHMQEYRKRTKQSKATIAAQIGISTWTYQLIETQRLKPTDEALERIADAMEMTVKELLSKPITHDRVFNNYQFKLILDEFHKIANEAFEVAKKKGSARGLNDQQIRLAAELYTDMEIKKQAQRYAANMGKPFAEVMRIWREHKND